ncbi:kelch repeat-containing protein [Marinobacter sp. JSM 1782161]|uniref:Kelch repeat-containing protein n=1 Tax=Marinobacter sp. JSM 1782161 TaxID=2685906 RepID=UPI001401C0BE|nr:kelch repeat-containing protein [Marinobacter sp. JSM 1782161]
MKLTTQALRSAAFFLTFTGGLRRIVVSLLLIVSGLTLAGQALAVPSLMVSSFPNRSAPASLSGAELSGLTYIFTTTESGITKVDFYLDNPPPSSPRKTEFVSPYDFNGTAPNDTAIPFDTQTINDGQHTVYARVTYSGGVTELVSAAFVVDNAAPAFEFSTNTLSFTAAEGDSDTLTASVGLDTAAGTTADFSISDNATWLSVSPTSGTTPGNLTVTASPDGLTAGSYSAVITASGDNVASDQINVSLEVTPAPSGDYNLLVSTNSSRSGASALQGAQVAGDIFVFVPDNGSINRVQFYLDDATKSGSPIQTEGLPPYDFAGTAPNDTAYPFDTTTLADGSHTITAVVRDDANTLHETTVFFEVLNDAVALSFSPTTLAGSRHIDNDDVLEHTVSLSASDDSGANFALSSNAAWLSASGNSGSTPAQVTVTASPVGLSVGTYTGTVTADADGYADASLTYTLTITDDPDGLVAAPASLTFSGSPDSPIASQSVDISHSMSETHDFTVSTNMPWLSASPPSGTTPQIIQVSVDASGMAAGNYAATVTITASGFPDLDIPVTLSLSSSGNCAPISCTDVRVELPYQLSFTESQGYLMDSNGLGTGFTWIDQPDSGNGYVPSKLEMNILEGVLLLTTNSGIQYAGNNNQENALGVGFAAPNQITRITAQLLDVPAGSGNYEQAGLWFGNDQDNYIKLVALSHPAGPRIHYFMEVGGQTVAERNITVSNLPGRDVTFTMIVNPYSQTVELRYQLDGGTSVQAVTLTPPDEFFSFDAAGIDPQIGTRSFTGIFGTHRYASSPMVYRFDDFTLEVGGTPLSPDSGIEFLRNSYDLDYPTSMVWGPDDRLYVSQLFGSIQALTFDEDYNLVDTETITSLQDALGPRLTLGITVGPNATAGNVDLWLAHSSPSIDDGEPNSGMITRLSGSGFNQVDNIITGLPRAKANHSINSIHFGDDNRLYIAVGGNTGAGAPNNSNSEFGDMQEQPLSAAIVVADVFAAGFDGTCANTSNIFGPPPCDVETYATGLRNSYDFVFHSNGSMYATDNGLGVTGTFPPSPEPPCLGFGSTGSYLNGGHNPGEQPDLLLRIVEGMYYGHPNPYRDECVFKDGSYQGVAPLPNYTEPLFNLGDHKSSNAIIEYDGASGCVGEFLNNQLLVTNYSIGDDIYRVLLNENGLQAVEGAPLVSGFNDPLPMTRSPEGVLFVGEFGGGKVTVLQPESLGCWETLAPLPAPVLDAAAASVNGQVYVVGGKNGSGHLNTLRIYNPGSDSWSTGASLPGEGVENPAVVASGGQIYVFGGSTAPFSGAVNNAAVYNPGSNSWTSLADMPTARGGATAQAMNGLIYVIGGMNAQGSSLNSVDIYNPSSGTWQTGPSMNVRRDNAASALLDGKIYVFGGRERNADGSVPNNTLVSVEMLTGPSASWSLQTPMPTGRRAMAIGTLNGKAQLMAGESNPESPSGVFENNEEYDPVSNTWRPLTQVPTPKHGAASATVNGQVLVIGGGVTSGDSYTSSVEGMTF